MLSSEPQTGLSGYLFMLADNSLLDLLLRGLFLGAAALALVMLQIRVLGLRSLSKMTGFDFVMTVALGSLVAGAAQARTWDSFAQALLAIAGLFIFQWLAARLRKTSARLEDVFDNDPVLLMHDGKVLHDALKKTRVSESDLRAKLREANVLDRSQVRAVVLETTGDVSVLHGRGLDDELLRGVKGAP